MSNDFLEEIARLRHALLSISDQLPPYTGEFTSDATPSDFGNTEDYAREIEAMSNAKTGDIARSALGVKAFVDGDKWCCVRHDFVNLQESPAGFGDEISAAYRSLMADARTPKYLVQP